MENATFKEYESTTGETFIERTNADGSLNFFPADSANSDYQAYLASFEETKGK